MNGNPTATITYEGPIAGNPDVLRKAKIKVDSDSNGDGPTLGKQLKIGASEHFPKLKEVDNLARYDKRVGVIHRQFKVDWTHAGESEDAIATREFINKREADSFKQYAKGSIEEREKGLIIRTITQAKVESHQETRSIKMDGWYRLCVASEYHPLIVEMDMRSGNMLGGMDPDTGHVFTFEKRAMLDQELLIDGDARNTANNNNEEVHTANIELQKELENQVKEVDLIATKTQMKHLNQMVAEMRKFQQDTLYRIKSHEANAQRNHENLVWSSKVETLLYVMITGLQVYTVHKWLLSNSMLGR